MATNRPAVNLPIVLREVGHVIFAYPRGSVDPSREGAPLSSVRLTQRKTGASRGMRATFLGWDREERQTLEYLVHAANAYPQLVAQLKHAIRVIEDLTEGTAHEEESLSSRQLLQSLGEDS